MRPIRIALTKGRLEKSTIALFKKMGLDCTELENKGRRLILPIPGTPFEGWCLQRRQMLLPILNTVFVTSEWVGKDTIMEYGGSFLRLQILGDRRCRFALACKKRRRFLFRICRKTIATKYPNVSRQFFEKKGMDVRIVKIEGSVELAPLLGLSDAIVDIVETGTTLRENGLAVIEDVAQVTARVIVNTVSMKLSKVEMKS